MQVLEITNCHFPKVQSVEKVKNALLKALIFLDDAHLAKLAPNYNGSRTGSPDDEDADGTDNKSKRLAGFGASGDDGEAEVLIWKDVDEDDMEEDSEFGGGELDAESYLDFDGQEALLATGPGGGVP